MNASIKDLGHRLKLLLGDVHFKSDYDQALDSPEQLLAIGDHNLMEYEKIESMDEERQERIKNIVSTILASVLQKEAMAKCGNTDSGSIRQVLHDWNNQRENKVYWDKFIQCAHQALAVFNLTEEQRQTMGKMLDLLPAAMIEELDELTKPLQLIPYAEAQQIASVLADMLKENHYVDSLRVN